MTIHEEYTNKWEYTAIHKNKIVGTLKSDERKDLNYLLNWIGDVDDKVYLNTKCSE